MGSGRDFKGGLPTFNLPYRTELPLENVDKILADLGYKPVRIEFSPRGDERLSSIRQLIQLDLQTGGEVSYVYWPKRRQLLYSGDWDDVHEVHILAYLPRRETPPFEVLFIGPTDAYESLRIKLSPS